MDSNDSMETPIEHIQGGDEDEIAKMIMSELEKQKKEKDEIARLERTLTNESPQPVASQPIPVQIAPSVVQPVQIQPEKVEKTVSDDIINKDALIIAVLVFILSQPSIQNFFPKTNPIIRTLLVSGLVAGGFFIFKKGNF